MGSRRMYYAITEALLAWFYKNGRKYSWREPCTPYELLIAEVMLQRTRADQVSPVYGSFLNRFPDVERLSQTSSKELMEFFSKLGLYRRVDQVKKLANELLSRFHGEVPKDREQLLSLPSVGDYIADAVLCFAFNKNVAVIDTNICRIIQRLFNVKVKGEARRDPQFKKLATKLLPSTKAKAFNWGMIDLGSVICLPKKPKCTECPLKKFCKYGINRTS